MSDQQTVSDKTEFQDAEDLLDTAIKDGVITLEEAVMMLRTFNNHASRLD